MEESSLNFNEFVRKRLREYSPERTAFCYDQRAYTFGMLSSSVDRYTVHLKRMGITKGSGVGYTMPNSPELPSLLLAISRVGAYAVPLFHMIPDTAKAAIFSRCRVRAIITNSRICGPIKQAAKALGSNCMFASIDPCADTDYPGTLNDDVGLDAEGAQNIDVDGSLPLLFAATSGTTGTPKHVAMTQRNVLAVMSASASMAAIEADCRDNGYSSVIAFPLSTSGILVTLGMLFSGVNIIFSSDMSPVKFLQQMDFWKAQSLSAPPAYFEALLSLPLLKTFNRASVTRIMTGMDFFSPSLMKRLCEAFPQVTSAANGYGLVETSTIFMHWKGKTQNELAMEPKAFTVAKGCDTEIDVRDAGNRSVAEGEEGELVVKGNSVVSSYLGNHPENATAFSNGWFRTGDSARKIDGSTMVLLGRKKYLIKRGGKSISPLVVQMHVNAHPHVLHSAVLGVPHQLYGEMIWCYIIARKDQECTLKDIMKHCRSSLPNYMVPDQIRFIEEIPKTPGVGKIDIEALINLSKKDLVTMEEKQNG